MQLTIGTAVECSDGSCGVLRRFIIDPVTRVVTHLVVGPKHGHGLGRLVPTSFVVSSGAIVRLHSTKSDFDRLRYSEELDFWPPEEVDATGAVKQVLPQPYFGPWDVIGDVPQPVSYDLVPPGDVEVRGREPVHGTDGAVGNVLGLRIDPEGHVVTHILLQQGHLWRRTAVAVPSNEVTTVGNDIELDLSRREVKALLSVAADDAGDFPAVRERVAPLEPVQGACDGR